MPHNEGFKELAIAAEEAGADLALIETMTDLYEIKAAILGVKENTNLPVVVSAMLDEGGKLLTGADIKALCATLEGLRVDAVGINCGFGPKQIARFIPEYLSLTSLPMMVNPNAGMPKTDDNGDSYYDMTPEDFAAALAPFAEKRRIYAGRMLRYKSKPHTCPSAGGKGYDPSSCGKKA